MIPTKAGQTTGMITPHDNGYYHEHDIYHHVPNENYDDNGRTNVIFDDDKENNGNNYNQYNDRITVHHRGASEDG